MLGKPSRNSLKIRATPHIFRHGQAEPVPPNPHRGAKTRAVEQAAGHRREMNGLTPFKNFLLALGVIAAKAGWR